MEVSGLEKRDFSNQILSQNDNLILGPFWRRRAMQSGRQPLGSTRPKVTQLRQFWAPTQARQRLARGRFGPPKLRPCLEPQGWRVEFGGPNPAVLARPEMRGRKVGHTGRDPCNRGPIWTPKDGSAPGPQNRPQMDPNSACNTATLQGRPMRVLGLDTARRMLVKLIGI